MSPAKHPHTITPPPSCFTVGTTHAEIIRSPTLHLTKTRRLEPKISNLDSSDQRTDFHRSNVYGSCSLAQASLFFFLLVSFKSGLFATIQPWRPDSHSLLWTVDVEMCLLLDLCDAFIFSVISEAVNSDEFILCSRGDSGSSILVTLRITFTICLYSLTCNGLLPNRDCIIHLTSWTN